MENLRFLYTRWGNDSNFKLSKKYITNFNFINVDWYWLGIFSDTFWGTPNFWCTFFYRGGSRKYEEEAFSISLSFSHQDWRFPPPIPTPHQHSLLPPLHLFSSFHKIFPNFILIDNLVNFELCGNLKIEI